jgi:hypothetical protein
MFDPGFMTAASEASAPYRELLALPPVDSWGMAEDTDTLVHSLHSFPRGADIPAHRVDRDRHAVVVAVAGWADKAGRADKIGAVVVGIAVL